jgi:hypothetical protein
VIEIAAGRGGEEIKQLALEIEAEMPQPVGDAAALYELRNRRERMPFDHIRRGLQHERAQHVRDRLQSRLVAIDPLGVARGELRDFRLRPAAADLEILPVIERQEIRDLSLDNAQSMLGQPQISNDLGIEQRHCVGCDRIAEAGMKLLRDGGAADDRTALQHHDLEPGHRQIGGASQTVVPASDDDRIVHEDVKTRAERAPVEAAPA